MPGVDSDTPVVPSEAASNIPWRRDVLRGRADDRGHTVVADLVCFTYGNNFDWISPSAVHVNVD